MLNDYKGGAKLQDITICRNERLMTVTQFFDELRKNKFTTGEIFSIIAHTDVDVKKITLKQLKKFIPGFRIILLKMVQYGDIIDRFLDIDSEPES